MTDPTGGEGESTWTRLTRRKVAQWGIAYAAGAWGFLQGLAYVTDTFHWPEQIQQLATLALLIGLAAVLILAWYHGDRGEQSVTRTELAILTLLFLLGGGLFWRYQHASETASVTTPAVAVAPAAVIADDKSIAVLPFVNMSPDQDQEYFADGLSEELLNLLTQLPQLRVIARTSSFSFKGKDADIAEIAQKLNVAHVLEGSVRRSGDTLRITAQLVRASDSSRLWSQTYERPMTDVFKVQDEIAAAVVTQLQVKLLDVVPRAQVTDPRAFVLFLQARQMMRQGTVVAADKSAMALLKEALALDPGYAAAWTSLAVIYANSAGDGEDTYAENLRLSRAAIGKALAIDPQYAPAYALLGAIAVFQDRDLAAAATLIERAFSLAPTDPDVIVAAAILARRLVRLDLAIALGEYAIARDPTNPGAHIHLSLVYRYAGRLDDAIGELRTALELAPDIPEAHGWVGQILLQRGEATAALAEILQEPDDFARLSALPMAYWALGRRKESDAALDELINRYGTLTPSAVATVLAFRGEADRAFEWLEKAARQRDTGLGSIPVYPMLANIHPDPRWLPFLRKVGMAPEQLAAIKFDVKVPQ